MTATAAIDAVGLVKAFGQLRAVDGVDLEVRQGEIFGVLGPNVQHTFRVQRLRAGDESSRTYNYRSSFAPGRKSNSGSIGVVEEDSR